MTGDVKPHVESPLPDWAIAIWLAGASAILLLATILSVGQGRDVLFPIGEVVLPETCTMHARFGIDCPGCGLTRSMIHLAHGDLTSAWRLSPMSILVFGFILVQVPLACAHFVWRKSERLRLLTRFNQTAFIMIMIGLVVQWLVRIAQGEIF